MVHYKRVKYFTYVLTVVHSMTIQLLIDTQYQELMVFSIMLVSYWFLIKFTYSVKTISSQVIIEEEYYHELYFNPDTVCINTQSYYLDYVLHPQYSSNWLIKSREKT